MRLCSKLLLTLCLLIIPSTLLLSSSNGLSVVRAQEDIVEEEDIIDDDDATVEADEEVVEEEAAVVGGDAEEEEEEATKPLKPSQDADTFLLFVKPTTSHELPAGRMVKLLAGFHNKGSKDFIVESLDASFRYPQDYSYFIQNFTVSYPEQTVSPGQEVSFTYTFLPSESFNSRPFGLSVLLHYKDDETNYMDALFNDTVNITELEEGLDGETFFLYLLLTALVVLVIVGLHQAVAHSNLRKKLPVGGKKTKPVIEMGTQGNSDVDYDWIPMDHVQGYKSSPGRSPKNSTSPKSRRKRNAGQEE